MRQLLSAVRALAQTFFAQRPVEAFNRGLLVLLVWPGNAMPIAIVPHMRRTRAFELRPPIGLDHLDVSGKAPGHGGPQEGHIIVAGERRPQQDICFLGVNIDSRKGEEVPKCDGIALDHRSSPRRHRDGAPLLILAPLGADDVFLRENLIELQDREPDRILPLQEIRDLLPTALMLAGAQRPHQALDCGRDLANLSGTFLGLRIARQKSREPAGRNALQP